MKILIFTFYFEPDLCAGSFRMSALMKQLKDNKDIEVEIVTTMPNRYASFEQKAKAYEKYSNLTIHRVELPSHSSGMLDQIKSFYAYYSEAKKIVASKEYELVFATSSRLFTAFLGAKVARNKSLPLYLDIRDIFVDTIKDVLNPKVAAVLKPILKLVENYTFSNAKHINLVSEGFKPYFTERFIIPSYSYYTNGIDDEFISSVSPTHPEKNSKSRKLVLYAGNIGEGQGLHSIIPELATIAGDNYHFKIIGDGGRKRQLEAACNGISNVSLHVPISRDELVVEYQRADILFLHLNDYPAFRKVLPSKIFEYGASGKPILAGVQGYSAEFIKEHLENAEVFSPNNGQGGLEALSSLSLKDTPRAGFVKKFQRDNIMFEMASTLLKLGNK